ncbi:PilE-like protein [Elusimicrobium minutum Pei191]|uniref:PilE-like protein n=1 Tax=Elusimicrobium minutum (strain Pei191) TaxID=445932 RepID=B2KEH5_ELUMP|nr:prepilin-type N-terminal cleavage/methylation domain-containing protein [Elusimicrobium minutum]ACC98921.1 PilE-like protein [Elusimicrobium minutum Pei191]
MKANIKKGFTLIELLVVVLIIGILAAIALPQYQKTADKSRLIGLLPLCKAIKDAEERYFLMTGEYTLDFDNLDVEMPSGSSSSTTSRRSYSNGDYFNLVADTPSTTWAVYGRNSKVLKDFLLRVTLDNGKSNGKIYCYAYNENKRAHGVCKSLGGKLSSTGCSSTGPCSYYQIL